MKFLKVNGNVYIPKETIKIEKLDRDDKETVDLLKQFLGADTIIEDKRKNVYMFCERVKEAEIIEDPLTE